MQKKLGLARGGLTKIVAVLCDQTERQADRQVSGQVDRKMNKELVQTLTDKQGRKRV